MKRIIRWPWKWVVRDASCYYEPRDLWVGLFYQPMIEDNLDVVVFYICIVPMWPIRIITYFKHPNGGNALFQGEGKEPSDG